MFGFTCTKGSRGDSTIITYDPGSHSIDSVIVVQLDGSRADMFCDSIVVGNKMYIGGHIIDKGVCLTVFNPDSNSVIETRCLRTNKTGCCNRVLYSNGVIYLIGALHDRVRYPPIPCLREYGYYAIYRNTRLWNKTSTKTIQLSPAIDTRYNISYTEYSLQLLNKTKHVEEIKILSASKTYDTVYSLYARPSTKVWFRVRGYDGVLSIESNAEVRIGSSTGYEVNITPRGMGVLYVYVGGKYVGEVVVVGDDNLVLFTNSTVLEWRYSNGVLDLWLKSRALVSVSTPRHGVVAIVSDYNTVCKGYRGCEILRDNDGVLVFTGKHIRIYTNKSLVKTTSSYSGYPLLGYVAYSTIPLAIVLVLLYRSKTKT